MAMEFEMDAATDKKTLLGIARGCVAACIVVICGLVFALAAGHATAWADDAVDQEHPLTTAPEVKKAGVIADGDYAVRSVLGTQTVLDVAGAAKKDGANVELDVWEKAASQKWHFAYNAEGGYYTITSKLSGMALMAVADKDGANVCVKEAGDDAGQRWIVSGKKGAYKIKSAAYSGLVLNVKGAASKSGTNIQVKKADGTKAQSFDIVALTANVPKSKVKITEGAYVIKTASGKAIDVAGSSIAVGANVQQAKRNGSYSQRFWIESNGDGYYRIIDVGSGLALESAGSDILTKANVRQGKIKHSATQLWSVSKSGKSYIFTNKASGNVLEVSGGSSADGANVQTNVKGAGGGQKFKLLKTTLLSSGTIILRGAFATGRVVEVPKASKAVGTALQMHSANGSAAQRFAVVKDGDKYTIQSGVSGRYVAVSGGKIVQQNAKYRWKVKFSTTGNRRGIVLVSANGKTALTAASTKQSAKLVSNAVTMKSTQRFLPSETQLIDNGNYMFQSGTGYRALDIINGSYKSGANVQIYEKNYAGAQIFEVEYVGDGYYLITNYGSGRCVSVQSKGVKKEGANVVQAPKGTASHKLWKPEILVGGKFAFRNKASGKLLTVEGNADANCANVVSASANGGKGQRWTLEEAAVDMDPAAIQRALSKINWKSSSTGYMIAVDLTKHYVFVFYGSAYSWKFYKVFRCTNGGSQTPTVLGDFYVGSKGYSFSDAAQTYTCYYWTQISGDYLFHSVLYHYQSDYIKDGTLGAAISHGCVRLAIGNAKWIQDNIPSGTHIYTYY